VSIGVSFFTQPKPASQLRGLVWAHTPKELRSPKREAGDGGWYRSPGIVGGSALAAVVVLNIVFG